MQDSNLLHARPLPITGICVIGLINATQMISLIMSPMSKQIGTIYPVYFSVSVLLSLACVAGLWLMKRQAALVYSMVLIVNQLVLLQMGYWEISAAVIPAIVICLLYKYRDNLV